MDFFSIVRIRVPTPSKDLSFIRQHNKSIICYPRSHTQDSFVPFTIELDHPSNLRPWANNAHLALKYIDELRKLIKLEPPKNSTYLGDTWIVGRRG